MYAKLENNKLTYAPKNYKTPTHLILNFNSNITLMEEHGFKEVVDIKPEYDNSTHYLSVDSYTEDENSITINYTIKDIEPIIQEPTLEDRVSQLETKTKEQEVEIEMNQDAINFLLFQALGVEGKQTKGANTMAAYLANQILKGKLSYELVVKRYPEFKEDIDTILILEGREDLIKEENLMKR